MAHGEYLLAPSKKVNQIYLYVLGEAAARFDIPLYAFVAMSNHHHVAAKDKHANFPRFTEHLGKMLGKHINRHRDRSQNVHATEQGNVCLMAEPADVLEKMLYTMFNPVKANAVEHCIDWPGASSLPLLLSGKPLRVMRPKGFFREEGVMPDFVDIQLTRAPGYEHMSHEEYSGMILARLRMLEEAARVSRRKLGKRVEGRKAVLAQEHTYRAPRPRRTIRPNVACKNRERMLEELEAIKEFRIAHRASLDRLRARKRRVVFPVGTYRVKLFGVRCVDPQQRIWVVVEPVGDAVAQQAHRALPGPRNVLALPAPPTIRALPPARA